MSDDPRDPLVVFGNKAISFFAGQGYVTMVIPVPGGTVGIRFISMEEMLTAFQGMMEAACLVWPDHDYTKEYLSE